ncbi:mannose-1-phosphate guanylyltransferase/mannose-6-phosphate isomerase [Desulfoluna spongiiphila]|uniref:mannose-1-phosphate guanylyltransferase n=1 Tax=Desulfoluna spongiiphila TaxID=419481 RepID=A0A1G5HZ77_9BACT|nr:mannose-1-phosphate guanylyltransferase/mannose-6-phosphate isomerase [Desulfoluna spongiiphila]SCY69017.1 mannose-1-phosphate guanylyltransferase/mannose-1-phosphate guanylyltransferase / mannose-6-phosphate isomerase [Desulfoluna spongiiphila]VVS94937.1 mannose-1-phosphate guanylyltransferase/mannose-6-phosphate isomerase [Desulfoluna spongiiphila]
MVIPVILAGGSGTRLWPLSRELHPKQLIGLIDEYTMLQNTVLRLAGFEGVGRPIVICNENHRFMVAEQLRSIGIDPLAIMLEPVGRNTAPALAAAACKALEIDENPTLLVLPADHTIAHTDKLYDAMREGLALAESGRLITFGIVPESAETGYGYIRKGAPVNGGDAVIIDRFVEKPDLDTAKAYVDSGDYCWNSGMFMFGSREVLGELERFAPEIVTSCREAVAKGAADLDFFRLDSNAFSACPEDSIDYAVMEKTDKGVMIALSAGWNDVGSWDAIWHIGKKDENGNVVKGDVITHDVSSSLLQGESRMIAAVGIEDMIVVETKDAVLVAPRDRGQDVKKIVSQLKADTRPEAQLHTVVYRPWGSYEGIDNADRFQVKRITVKPGAELSLQKHFHRAEHWVVVRGTAIVTRDEEKILLKEDESTYISLGTVHRLENPGKIPLELIEVQSGSYLGEDDIVRLEDNYGR